MLLNGSLFYDSIIGEMGIWGNEIRWHGNSVKMGFAEVHSGKWNPGKWNSGNWIGTIWNGVNCLPYFARS